MSSTSTPTSPVPTCTAVVVSGGSRGLGLAIVRDLLVRGVKVATFSRSLSDELVDLQTQSDGALFAQPADVTDTQAVKTFLHESEDRFGVLDGLVNNAAVGQDSLLVHTAPDRISAIIETNLAAPLLLTRQFIRRSLARSSTCRIAMITSVCAQRGYSGLVAYAATKGGLEAAVRTLAREMHGRALVNAVAPGFFASEMSSVLGGEQLATITRRTPSGRLVEPDDLLPIVRTLLLEQTNINGQVITVDGGSSI